MSITSVTKLVENAAAQETQDAEDTRDQFTDYYLVQTDDSTHSQAYITANAAVPVRGEPHPERPNAWVADRDLERAVGSARHWIFAIRYSSDLRRFDGSSFGPPVTRSITTRKVPWVLRTDRITGTPIANSAGVPFSAESSTIQRSLRVATYRRREFSFDENAADQFVDHVNSTVFKGKGTKTVFCEDISAEENPIIDAQNGIIIPNWDVTYVFVHDPLGWLHRPLDEGFQQLNDAGDDLEDIYIDDIKVAEPWPLDGSGKAVTQADLQTGNIVVLSFNKYPTVDFNALNL